MNKIVVTGGTGVLGSVIVKQLQEQGCDFTVVSRNRHKQGAYSQIVETQDYSWQRVDLSTGDGVVKALTHADTVIHLASAPGMINNEPFEVASIRQLLAAAQKTDINHLIYVSIVGVDRIPFSYYKAKLASEQIVERSHVPYTILRATQFHNFIDYLLGKLFAYPVAFVPKKLKAQPISVEAVATELMKILDAGPQHDIVNLGGRQVLDVGTMAESWQRYQPNTKPVWNVPVVGTLMNAFAKGYNTCPEIASTSETWEEYLIRTYKMQEEHSYAAKTN
jgi:uncharacterized protein YbjT (DUF2867 family)